MEIKFIVLNLDGTTLKNDHFSISVSNHTQLQESLSNALWWCSKQPIL